MGTPSKAQLLKASFAKRKSKKRKTLAVKKTQAAKKMTAFFMLWLLGGAFIHQLFGKRTSSIPSPRHRKHNRNLALTENVSSHKTFLNAGYNQTDATVVTHESYHVASVTMTTHMNAALKQLYSFPPINSPTFSDFC